MENKAIAQAADADELSHNLVGQRLGRKGRDTRERIMAAAERLLAMPGNAPISLSAVAREASLAMTTLYLYFADLTELLIAILAPIMEAAEDAYVARLRRRWPDEDLARECAEFIGAFFDFWAEHARILHLRNNTTLGEPRMVRHRVAAARPVIDLMITQMDADPARLGTIHAGVATAIFTGLERFVTVTTDETFAVAFDGAMPNTANLMRGQAKLLELAIRDARSQGGKA